jgi:hypothetical protein
VAQTLPPGGRLPDEPAKQFAAFCIYRDLGPGRSIALAVRRAKQRDAAGTLRRWEEWSSRFGWVERAAAYDAHLDAQDREMRAKLLAELQGRRFKFEIWNQRRIERRIARMEKLIDRCETAPPTDTVKRERKKVGRRVVVTEIEEKGLKLSGYASVVKQANETAKQAVLGVRPPENDGAGAGEEDVPHVDGIVWVPDDEEPGDSSKGPGAGA